MGVHSYLAGSRKEELVLVSILNNLQIAVVSGDSSLSFLSFIACCKSNSKIGRLIVSTQIEKSMHLFVLVQAIHSSQEPLLIHLFLSEKEDENEQSVQRLTMEIIGRSKPQKSAMNRQCLNDFIAVIEAFVKS